MQPVFDGHNDVLLRLWNRSRNGGDPVAEFMAGVDAAGVPGRERGHIDLPRARAGGLAGGFCAIWIPSEGFVLGRRDANGLALLPPPLERELSLDIARAMAGIATSIDKAGGWKLCRSTADIKHCIDEGVFAALLHMEGCEALAPDLDGLAEFHAMGLRSLGPVWSRPNVFGHGVPFGIGGPDTGPGLTDAGKALIKACNELGIMVDLSHITEKGFWDVAAISDQPLVATHSNVHAITPSTRNLTDRQLDAIRDTDGVVGLNFAVAFLREDGAERADTGLATMVRHIDYLVDRLGINGVAIGSDFDGALIPAAIGDAAGLQNLVGALRGAGYGDEDLTRICRDNWLRVLRSAWREPAAA